VTAARHGWATIAVLALIVAASPAIAQPRATSGDPFAAFAGSLTAVPEASKLTQRGVFYVPAYSSIRAGSGRTRLDLSVTLSIHNISESDPLVVERIDYYDTSGALVQRYITQPIALKPFGTVEVFIATDDIRGGTGANFIVGWAAPAPTEPMVETVMIGTSGTSGYSFTSPGRAIKRTP
jgi:hypothetical protein